MKSLHSVGILLFVFLATSAPAQERPLYQAIPMAYAREIGFRKRVEKIPPKLGPPPPPRPGFNQFPPFARSLHRYDVVLIENESETILETVEIIRIDDLKSGVTAPFELLAAFSPAADEVVYVSSTQGKFYVNSARRGSDGAFHKVCGELVDQGIRWEKVRFEQENGALRLIIHGNPRAQMLFEQQASGAFRLISEMRENSNGMAKTAPANREITALNRFCTDRTWLILRKNGRDLLTVPDTPQGIIPKLQDVHQEDDQLALIVDYDFAFRYQLYLLKDGNWTLQSQSYFNAMDFARRARLLLVQLTDLAHVTLTYTTGPQDLFREKRDVREGDRQDIFEFGPDIILKNGSVYNFRNGLESGR
jgi:hypothetical protein